MLTTGKKIRIDSGKGAVVEINTDSLKPGVRLQSALDQLLAGESPKKLDPEQIAKLAKKKSLIGSGVNALIIRFDLKVVRIDERLPIDLGRLVRQRTLGQK